MADPISTMWTESYAFDATDMPHAPPSFACIPQTVSFLTLPFEIREQIYEEIFAAQKLGEVIPLIAHKGKWVLSHGRSRTAKKYIAPHGAAREQHKAALFLVSRQISLEARRQFWSGRRLALIAGTLPAMKTLFESSPAWLGLIQDIEFAPVRRACELRMCDGWEISNLRTWGTGEGMGFDEAAKGCMKATCACYTITEGVGKALETCEALKEVTVRSTDEWFTYRGRTAKLAAYAFNLMLRGRLKAVTLRVNERTYIGPQQWTWEDVQKCIGEWCEQQDTDKGRRGEIVTNEIRFAEEITSILMGQKVNLRDWLTDYHFFVSSRTPNWDIPYTFTGVFRFENPQFSRKMRS